MNTINNDSIVFRAKFLIDEYEPISKCQRKWLHNIEKSFEEKTKSYKFDAMQLHSDENGGFFLYNCYFSNLDMNDAIMDSRMGTDCHISNETLKLLKQMPIKTVTDIFKRIFLLTRKVDKFVGGFLKLVDDRKLEDLDSNLCYETYAKVEALKNAYMESVAKQDKVLSNFNGIKFKPTNNWSEHS